MEGLKRRTRGGTELNNTRSECAGRKARADTLPLMDDCSRVQGAYQACTSSPLLSF